MDIDLDEMGLIDSSTEFIQGLGDSSIIYSQDGTINISADDLVPFGNKVTYLTLPNLVQIIQDGNSQNVGYLINNSQISSVSQPIIVNQDGFVEITESDSLKENSDNFLREQLTDYLAPPPNLNTTSEKLLPKENARCSAGIPIESRSLNDDSQDVDPPDKTGNMHCQKCNLTFNSWKLYEKHKWKHLYEKPFQCNFCPESFNYELNLNLHLATHDLEKPYCPVCKKHFNRVASLKAHIMLHEQEESIFCNECGEEFASPIYLIRHMAEHRNEKLNQLPFMEKVFRCKLCDQTFDTASSCKIHRIKYHKIIPSRKIKKFKRRGGNNKCEYCQKCFDKPSQLLRHKRIHTGERPYKCELCTRAFNQKGSLQIHMLKHTRERPYVCQHCNGTFSQKGNLQAHVKRLHMEPEGDETVYKCKLCTCIFRKLGSLNAHFTKVHNDVSLLKQMVISESFGDPKNTKADSSSDSSNKENESAKKDECTTDVEISVDKNDQEETNPQKTRAGVCTYCSKGFKRPGDLIRHIRTHTLEKPFKCKVCSKSFSIQSTLSIHLKTHTEARKYICPTCNKCYSNARNLKLHRKRHFMRGENSRDKNTVYEGYCESSQDPVDKLCEVPSSLVCLDQVDMSSLDGSNIILTESGNIVDMSSDIEPDDGNEKNTYKCPECRMVFTKQAHLLVHLQTHNLHSYTCEYCPCSFNSKNTLNLHLRQHHKLKPKEKQSSPESDLKEPKEVESSENPWACPLCGWVVKTYNAVIKHIDNSHPDANKNETIKPLKVVENIEAEVEEPVNTELPATKTPISVVVLDQTNDSQAAVPLQPNQYYIIANEEGGFNIVPPKTINQTGQLEDYSFYQEGDLVLNTTDNINSQKQVLGDSLDGCIFTLQPEIGVDNAIISSPIPSTFISNAQQINRCDLSNLILTNINDFPVDKTIQLTEKLQTCITCDKSFSSTMQYEDHLKLHKTTAVQVEVNDSSGNIQNTVFSCQICSLDFLSFDDLTSHQEIHLSTNKNKNACGSCSAQFSSLHELQEHNKVSCTIEEVTHCSLCVLDFTSEEEFENHCHKYHATEMLKIEKKKARLSWRPPARMLTEEETKALSKIEPDNPSEKVLLQSLLEKERFEHPVKEMQRPPEIHQHKCKYCPKTFRKPSDLTRHLRTHTGEKPYKCSSCSKRFSIKSAAASHMKTHTKDKSYECYICTKMFSTTGSLKIHMRLHTGLKPFACNICDARFRTSGHKKAHWLKHLRVNVEEPEKKEMVLDRPFSRVNMTEGPILKSNSTNQIVLSTNDMDSIQEIHTSDQGSQYLVPLQTESSKVQTDDELLSFKISDQENGSLESLNNKTSKFLLNINDEGGGNGDTPRYFLSIKDGGTGEDGFVLESISDDQIVVTITKGDSDIPRTSSQEEFISLDEPNPFTCFPCSYCKKTFTKQVTLDKHVKKFHVKEIFQCSVCLETFERKSDLDVHCLAHELDREFTCPECNECFSLEEELRAHKCIKSTALELSLDHDLFLFP